MKVMISLVCANKLWTPYSHHIKNPNYFHLNCLGKLTKIKWEDWNPPASKCARYKHYDYEGIIKTVEPSNEDV